MNYFFDNGNKLTNSIDWMFNSNHLLLICCALLCGFVIISLIKVESEKQKRIVKIVLASVMIILEIGRIGYNLRNHVNNNGTIAGFDWWWQISFQMCAQMSWLTSITLLISAFSDYRKRYIQILYNILFGCAMIGGILTYVYPDFIHQDHPILHFVNFQTIFVHLLLVIIPLVLIKMGELKISLKNIWMPAFGYLWIGSVALTAAQISGHNFAFAFENPLFTEIGLTIAYPYHWPLTLLIVFTLTLGCYLIFDEKHCWKLSAINMTYLLPFLTGIILTAILLIIPFLLGYQANGEALKKWSSLLIMLPISCQIGIMIVYDKKQKRRVL